ncbi:hypothetical protein [Kitasatospora purpeofusca]|uniref:hypothetical protein n=1 Tax=Kitasatospora purpeofusca TaxID=67352 RepID=UPI0035DE7652
MPSVMGLLEERERAARRRVEALRAELWAAEAAWERFMIARQAVAADLAGPRAGDGVPSAGVAGERAARVAGPVPGSVVPAWREGLGLDLPTPDCRRLVEVLAGRGEEMDRRRLAAASGPEVEGERSKVKRPAARGWPAEGRPGMFSVLAGRGGGS